MDKCRKYRQEGYNLCKVFERKLKEDGYHIYCVDICWPAQNYTFYWFIAKDRTYKRFQTAIREVMRSLKKITQPKKIKGGVYDNLLNISDAFFTGMAKLGFHYMRDVCYNETFEEEVRVVTTGCYMEKHKE
jgi:hypothetical protein